MSEGTILATFVVVFRETLEAGLIVGIILTMLYRIRAMQYAKHIWVSVLVAVAASCAVGWMLGVATESIQGHWEKVIEGVISLIACAVLTHMVFWMDRQAKQIRPDIEAKVETAVVREQLPVLMLLPFLAVFREGAETVLFLKAIAIQSSQAISWIGGLAGGALAVTVTTLIFYGGRRIPLRTLFRSTSWLLVLFAAGLLAYGIHELQELGWIPMVVYPVWNINHILNEKEGVGSFLKALFGYNGNPSLIEVMAYLSYLFSMLWALRAGQQTPQSSIASGSTPVRPTPAVQKMGRHEARAGECC